MNTKYTIPKGEKIERWNKIALSAMKQSIKAYRPKLNEPVKFNDFISENTEGTKLIAHCETNPKPSLKSKLATNNKFTAFNINSIHMSKIIALRRINTPTTPIMKSTVLNTM